MRNAKLRAVDIAGLSEMVDVFIGKVQKNHQ